MKIHLHVGVATVTIILAVLAQSSWAQETGKGAAVKRKPSKTAELNDKGKGGEVSNKIAELPGTGKGGERKPSKTAELPDKGKGGERRPSQTAELPDKGKGGEMRRTALQAKKEAKVAADAEVKVNSQK